MEPPQNAATAAAEWIVAVLTGAPATSAAIVVIAGLGLPMLAGRLPLRRSLSVVLGCFIVFGAPVIATGLTGRQAGHAPVTLPAEPVAYTPTGPAPVSYDPYAGAAVPVREAGPAPQLLPR